MSYLTLDADVKEKLMEDEGAIKVRDGSIHIALSESDKVREIFTFKFSFAMVMIRICHNAH